MPIICGTRSGFEGAMDAAHALAQRTSLQPLHTVNLDAPNAHETLLHAASTHAAELIVVPATSGHDEVVASLAHQAAVPLLVVRDAAPFVAWDREQRALRAVLGWDETTTTTAAIGPLTALRTAGPIDIEVVHVYFPDEAASRYGIRVESMVAPSAELESLLRRDIAHRLGEVGTVLITPLLGLGHIGEHLVDYATRIAADLVVVGTHHRRGLRRLSSVAERVLDQARTSVMLVPQDRVARIAVAPDFQVAVVATDGTAFANTAVSYAYRLVHDGGEVHLVRVVANGERSDDRSLLDGLMALDPGTRTRTIPHVVRDRDPAHAIAVAAERFGADVVCIASHGRAGISRAVMGSVTDRLLHLCKRPVLVLHPVE